MASRCGCSGTCACVLTTDSSLTLSGNGSAASPWLLKVVPNCTTTMNCVAANVTTPVTVTAGKIGVKVSTDTNQALKLGTDGGLYVASASAGGVTIADTPTIDLAGTGQVGNPLTAAWLGAAVSNTNNSGVQLNGTGTAADPLNATWSGISTTPGSPEMSITGRGTPTAPMAVNWSGLPWIRFKLPSLIVANGATDVPIPWSNDTGYGTPPATIGGPSNRVVSTARPGSYIMLVRIRQLLTASATTLGGYFQAYWRNASTMAGIFDFVVSTYGSQWVDMYAAQVVTLTTGGTYTMTVNNFTGSDTAAGGYIFLTLIRISD